MRKLLASLAVLTLAAACAPTSNQEPGKSGVAELRGTAAVLKLTPSQAPAYQKVIDSCNSMGLGVLQRNNSDNTVFSPTSWCMALGMLGNGTSNNARTQFETAFGASVDDVNKALAALHQQLKQFDADPASVKDDKLPQKPVLHHASNVMVHQGLNPRAEFLDALTSHYESSVHRLDLTDSRNSKILDEWVKKHTGNRIKESAIKPSSDLRMVLQDAILMAGAWGKPLDEEGTLEFTNADGSHASLPKLKATGEFPYAAVDGWQAAQLALGEDFKATFILPPQEGAQLTPELRNRLMQAMKPTELAVLIPQFEVKTTTNLLEEFDALNMADVIDATTKPLENIDPSTPLKVTDAVQQASLMVNRHGTVAAAVTEIGVREASAPIPPELVLELNRAFYMTITHHDSGVDVFQSAIRKLEKS